LVDLDNYLKEFLLKKENYQNGPKNSNGMTRNDNRANLVRNFVGITDGIDGRLQKVETNTRKFLQDKKNSKAQLHRVSKNNQNYKFLRETLSTQGNFYVSKKLHFVKEKTRHIQGLKQEYSRRQANDFQRTFSQGNSHSLSYLGSKYSRESSREKNVKNSQVIEEQRSMNSSKSFGSMGRSFSQPSFTKKLLPKMEHKYIDHTMTITEDDKESVKNDSDLFYQDASIKKSGSRLENPVKSIKVKTEKLQKFKNSRNEKYSFSRNKNSVVVDCKNGKLEKDGGDMGGQDNGPNGTQAAGLFEYGPMEKSKKN
jgi:hypothetical protein